MRRAHRAVIRLAGGSAAVLACAALAAGTDLEHLAEAKYVHCAFFPNHGPSEPGADREEGAATLIVHFQGLGRPRSRWRTISTGAGGAREVRVVRTERAVHFIDHVAGMFHVTTVFGCNARNVRLPGQPCVTYGAVNVRHFDGSVYHQPDRVFDELRTAANHGFCDHSFRGID